MDIDYTPIKWKVIGIDPGVVKMGVASIMIDRNNQGWDRILSIVDWELVNLVEMSGSKKGLEGIKYEVLVSLFSDFIRNHLLKSIELLHADPHLKIAYVIETQPVKERHCWLGSLIMFNTLKECIRWISATLVPKLHNRIFVRLNPGTEKLKTPVTDCAQAYVDLYKSSDVVSKHLNKKIKSYEKIASEKTGRPKNKALAVLLTMSLLANKIKADQLTHTDNNWKKWGNFYKDLLMMTKKEDREQERDASDALLHACSFAFLEIIKMPDYIKPAPKSRNNNKKQKEEDNEPKLKQKQKRKQIDHSQKTAKKKNKSIDSSIVDLTIKV